MKTTGVSGIPKFGLLDFLGHPRGHSLFVFLSSSVFEQILSKRLKFKIIIKEKVLNEVEIAVSSLIV